MYEAFSYFYTSIASLLIASTVNPAEPKAPAFNFGQIQPALSFGVSCKAALQTLDRLGLTYHQQAERDWIVITSGHMLGHPLNQADDSSLRGAETSKLWCSQAPVFTGSSSAGLGHGVIRSTPTSSRPLRKSFS